MKKLISFLLVFTVCSGLLSCAFGFTMPAVLESDYQADNQYGPYIGEVVAQMNQQSWVRKEDSKYKRDNPSQETEKIGTIEDGARLPCVGLMVDSGWYRVVANGQIAYISYKYTWLDTSTYFKPQVANPLPIIAAQASSERPRSRWTDGAGNYYYYYAQNVIDGNLITAWTPGSGNNLIGNGIGEFVDLNFQNIVTLSGVQVLNGYQRSKEAFYENNRPQKIEITFKKNGSPYFENPITFDMYDNLVGWQHLNFDPQQDVIAFRLKVLDIYQGLKHTSDVGIAEVRASGF